MTLILFNNRLLEKRDAKISMLSDAFARGYGIFETLRTFRKKPLQPKEHIDRLFRAAGSIGLKPKYTKSEIAGQLHKISQKSPHQNQRLRITAIHEGIIITSEKLAISRKIYQGVACLTVAATRSMPEIKSISYLPSFLSHKKAVEKGYYEAILTDSRGEIYEGAYSNLFWFEGNTLCTRKEGILPGITRQTILKISPFHTKFKNIQLKKLLKQNEIFLTSSLTGIVPVISINKTKIGNGIIGQNTTKLMRLYHQAISK